jgi:uroporphyrin-III C-methyltransferase
LLSGLPPHAGGGHPARQPAHQRHAVTTLGQLHATMNARLASPSVIVVGDVVSGLAAAQAPQLFRAA